MAAVARRMMHVGCTEGSMPRSVVGLLAAIGVAVSALVGLTHGDVVPIMVATASTATGLGAYLALLPIKKISQ
jgi:hypothetical protein